MGEAGTRLRRGSGVAVGVSCAHVDHGHTDRQHRLGAHRKTGSVMARHKQPAADPHRLVDATLDDDITLDTWPPPPPRQARTAIERTRLALIAHPGQIRTLTWALSDVGRANALASSFRRARPSKLDPAATGHFDARAFYDPANRKWRIAARYLPAAEAETHPPSGSDAAQ